MPNEYTVLGHNCIRFENENGCIIYTDPFRLQEAPHDADLILVTHDHYDHLSTEDIGKLAKPGTQLVMPEGASGELPEQITGVFFVRPDESYEIDGVRFSTVASYNINKPFHPREKGWVGYVIECGGKRYYVAGDTDATPEAEAVQADVAFLPVGGTFTMTAEEAATLALSMNVPCAVPVHYAVIVGEQDDADRFNALIGGKAVC